MRKLLLRVVQSAPVRMVLGAVFLISAVFAREVLLGLIRAAAGIRQPPRLWLASGKNAAAGASDIAYAWFGAALMIALGLGAYRLFLTWFEKRRPKEVSRPVTAELALGSLLGISSSHVDVIEYVQRTFVARQLVPLNPARPSSDRVEPPVSPAGSWPG